MQILDSDLKIIARIAKSWASKSAQDADELASVAAVEILKASEPDKGNHVSHIVTLSRQAIAKFLSNHSQTIGIPQTTRHRRRPKELHKVTWNEELPVSKEPGSDIEILDSLRHATDGPVQAAYMEMRLAGYSHNETIIELDIAKTSGFRMLKSIEQRFKKDWYE